MPELYTIPAGRPFLDDLAAGLWAQAGEDPLRLTEALVLLPTRRAVRGLREAFLRIGDGRPMLLPEIRPLGDALAEDEIGILDSAAGAETETAIGTTAGVIDSPPAVPGLRRQMLLTRLVHKYAGEVAAAGDGAGPRAPGGLGLAAMLAGALGRLIDEIQTEELSFDRLAGLAPAAYARHWQTTLTFLEIATQHWPAILAAEDATDPVIHRRALSRALVEAWQTDPPSRPVIVAGSTGSVPSTAAIMEAVLRLPRGAVVLPGLDQISGDADWQAIGDDPTHPQFGLSRLLDRLAAGRGTVNVWPWSADGDSTAANRRRLMVEVMRPAETSEAWRRLSETIGSTGAAAVEGLHLVTCRGIEQEAGLIALLLRQALETPGRTAALVTPDRRLARRVKAELRRWDIEIDDSGGEPLGDVPAMAFLRLTAELAARQAAPVSLLSVLKHPLAAGGVPPAECRRRARLLERAVLRGPAPGPGIDGLLHALRAAAAESTPQPEWLAAWIRRLAPPLDAMTAALTDPGIELAVLLDHHLELAESLAASDAETGAARLWAGEAGAAAAGFFAELRAAALDFGPLPGSDYPALLSALLAGRVHRPRFGRHLRLALLGPLEARLHRYDLTVLGGLNEGVWPARPAPDPWMSRQMRLDFGLDTPERRIGLAAHDIVMGCGAPMVVLTRADRVDGTPTIPSRWLLRLETVARTLGLSERLNRQGVSWRSWQEALDRPDLPPRPAEPPAPRPPVSVRPRRFSVTQIETWIRDPYAIYARHILNLRALEPLEAELGAADRGRFIHAALHHFVRERRGGPPDEALERLLRCGREAFGPALDHPAVRAFWWPRFEQIAHWFVYIEQLLQEEIAASSAEIRGSLTLDGPAGPVMLTAIADRIDRLTAGGYAVIDYKTGDVPTNPKVAAGLFPQLPLEALILQEGGFEGLPAGEVKSLSYWHLRGGASASEVKVLKNDPEELADRARHGLSELIRAFDDPGTAYHSQPDPGEAPTFSDYAHLARVKEWSVTEDQE